MSTVGRREALRRIGKAALVVGGSAAIGRLAWDRGAFGSERPRSDGRVRDFRVTDGQAGRKAFAIARSESDPAKLVAKALGALGGMARFVRKGDVVALKPNIGWDRLPAQAANTNPKVVAELVRQARAAGARQVIVSDVSCNDAGRSFQRSGIQRAAAEAGATVILPAEHRFRDMQLGGRALGQWPMLAPLIDVDKLINVPVAKHHGLARFTGALKNWYGLLGGHRSRLHQDLDTSIADLASFVRPTLTVVDGTRVLMRSGPQGGNIADTREANTVVASTDQVAADAFACTLIGIEPEQLGYLRLAAQRGLGTLGWKSLPMAEI